MRVGHVAVRTQGRTPERHTGCLCSISVPTPSTMQGSFNLFAPLFTVTCRATFCRAITIYSIICRKPTHIPYIYPCNTSLLTSPESISQMSQQENRPKAIPTSSKQRPQTATTSRSVAVVDKPVAVKASKPATSKTRQSYGGQASSRNAAKRPSSSASGNSMTLPGELID